MSLDLDQLAERIESLEDDLEAEKEERRRLEDELEDERERRRELEQRLEQRENIFEVREPEDGSDPTLSDLWAVDAPLGRLVHRMDKRMKKLEKRLEDEDPEAAAQLEENAPPVYTLLKTPPERLKPTERRTRFLWADLSDYATRTPKGYVLPASDARRVLEAAEPEDSEADRITSNHVGRVFDLSLTLTREAAFVRKKDGERQLVVPSDWEEQAREAAPYTGVS